MNYRDLVNQKLLKKEAIGFDQINRLIRRAFKDFKSAEVLIKTDEEVAFSLAYQAMLHAGRALVFSQGFRPSTYQAHKTVVECTKRTLGKEYKVLVVKFDKMRKKRHKLMYEATIGVSATEARNAIKSAYNLVRKIREEIQKKSPQKRLIK